MTTLDTYWKVSLYSTSTKRMLFASGSVSRGPFLSHQAGYHYHSYSLGLVLKSTITIHEYTSLYYKQSHTSRKNDVFIVLESETTLPLIIVVIIQNRRKITPKKTLDQFPFLLFTDIYSSSIRTFWVSN